MTRVLIADDHPFVLAGLVSFLRDTDYEVVGTANDGAAVLEKIPALRPDILVLDLQMPRTTGIDVVRTLRGRGDGRPIVLLTASIDDQSLLEAIDLGIQGIVLKDGAEHLLVRCLDEIRKGGRWIDHSLLQHALDLKMDQSRPKGPLDSLTARERAVVGLVARGRRNREIADELRITEGTVKVYLHRIYEKLGVSNRTELALLAQGEPEDR